MVGVSSILENSVQNPGRFLQLLSSNDNVNNLEDPQKTAAVFYAILHALRNSPKNLEIIIFMSRKIKDEDLSLLVAKELRGRATVFVVWMGSVLKNEQNILEEISVLSGGDLFIVPKETVRDIDVTKPKVGKLQCLGNKILYCNLKAGD